MIKVILWDIDGTLLNFKKAEKYAIRECFSSFNLGECTDEMIRRYSIINDKYWKSLERGEITKQEVLHNRFEEFFEKENINFDEIDAFNKNYQFHLGDSIFFNDESFEMLQELKGYIKQYAVTNGTYAAQERKLRRSGLDRVFDDVFISEVVGIDKPNKAFFDAVWKKIGKYRSEEIMIVGDSLTSDIQGGNNAGILCCWYNPDGENNKSELKIDYEIQNLQQVRKIIENHSIANRVRKELKENIDEQYKEFHKSLVPGLQTMLGVRVPKLREIARRTSKNGYYDFVRHADYQIYEELLICGMMIGYGDFTKEERKTELQKFVPLINNWAVCDCSCSTYKFMKKEQEEWFSFITQYAGSENEFELRFAIVCLLDFFVNEAFIDRILKLFSAIHHEGYYVKMAVAWAISVCYVKFPEKTEKILAENLLDDFTHNKSIQKIRESYRVSKENKEYLKNLKRS